MIDTKDISSGAAEALASSVFHYPHLDRLLDTKALRRWQIVALGGEHGRTGSLVLRGA